MRGNGVVGSVGAWFGAWFVRGGSIGGGLFAYWGVKSLGGVLADRLSSSGREG
jgi:hypothetical protein